jgi:hypothetical protein
MELNRNCYGFEIKKDFYKLAKEQMLNKEYSLAKNENDVIGQMKLF